MALPFRRGWQAARGRLWAGARPSASARALEPAAGEPLPRRGRPAGRERGQGRAGVNAGPTGLGVPGGHGASFHPRGSEVLPPTPGRPRSAPSLPSPGRSTRCWRSFRSSSPGPPPRASLLLPLRLASGSSVFLPLPSFRYRSRPLRLECPSHILGGQLHPLLGSDARPPGNPPTPTPQACYALTQHHIYIYIVYLLRLRPDLTLGVPGGSLSESCYCI